MVREPVVQPKFAEMRLSIISPEWFFFFFSFFFSTYTVGILFYLVFINMGTPFPNSFNGRHRSIISDFSSTSVASRLSSLRLSVSIKVYSWKP